MNMTQANPQGTRRIDQKKILLSQDPNKAMQEMMDTIDTLRDVYETETEALLGFDTNTFLQIQDTKLAQAELYQNRIQQMLARKDELRSVNPEMKKQLEKMQKDFAELSHNNMIALKRMQRTMERLTGTIQDAARDAAKRQRSLSYGQTGRMDDGGSKKISVNLSETA